MPPCVHLEQTGFYALAHPDGTCASTCLECAAKSMLFSAPLEGFGLSKPSHLLAVADALLPLGQRRRSGFACGERQGGRRGRSGGRSVGVDGRQASGGGCGALRTARGPLAVDRGDQRRAAVVPVQPGVPGGKRLLELVLEVIPSCAKFLCARVPSPLGGGLRCAGNRG